MHLRKGNECLPPEFRASNVSQRGREFRLAVVIEGDKAAVKGRVP